MHHNGFCRKPIHCILTTLMALEDLKSRKFWKGLLAECLATALFVFFVCCSILTQQTVLLIAFTAGFTITTMVFCIGPVTGGHINPVVSLAFMARRKVSIITGVFYIVAQFLGAIIGSALVYVLTPVNRRGDLGVTSLTAGLSSGQGFGIECILTFVLLMTIFAASDTDRKLKGYEISLAIGVAVFICHLVGVYWVGPITGSLIGTFLYDFVLSESSNGIAPLD